MAGLNGCLPCGHKLGVFTPYPGPLRGSWWPGLENSLDRDRGDSRGDLAQTPTLHQLDCLFHLHLVIESDELGLLGALPCNQALLHVLLVEAVQPSRGHGGRNRTIRQSSPRLSTCSLLPALLLRPAADGSSPSSTGQEPLQNQAASKNTTPLLLLTVDRPELLQGPSTSCSHTAVCTLWCDKGVQPCSLTHTQPRTTIHQGGNLCFYSSLGKTLALGWGILLGGH